MTLNNRKILAWYSRPWQTLIRSNIILLVILFFPLLGDLLQGGGIDFKSRYFGGSVILFLGFNFFSLYFCYKIHKSIMKERLSDSDDNANG
jgi:hypothetical protein